MPHSDRPRRGPSRSPSSRGGSGHGGGRGYGDGPASRDSGRGSGHESGGGSGGGFTGGPPRGNRRGPGGFGHGPGDGFREGRPARPQRQFDDRADNSGGPGTFNRPRRPHAGRRPDTSQGGFDAGAMDGDVLSDSPTPDIGLGVRLVYEDDDVVVVDKPTGIVTAPMPGTPEHDNPEMREHSVFGVVKHYIKDKRRKRGTRVWIIHRLDKEASGLLVFAASDRAFEQLKEEFRTKRAHRLYMAVAEGEFSHDAPALPGRTPQPPSGIIRSFLAEGPDGLMRSINPDDPRMRFEGPGQNAVTHWRVVASGAGRTLLQLRLDTGRKNQIRVHMREAGHALVGDRRYGGKSNPISRLCLHATELGFSHPATGSDVRFFSPPPQAFYGLVNQQPPQNSLGETRPGIVGTPPAVPGAAKPKKAEKPGRESGPDTSWDHVAEWYDQLIGTRKSDHHENVILPGVLRLLQPQEGMRILDLACGQGDFCRRLAELGVAATGIDSSEKLIESARASVQDLTQNQPEFVVGDARKLGEIAEMEGGNSAFAAATSVMALMNIEPLEPVLTGVNAMLREGGKLVFVILHPAFRAPGQTSWGWEEDKASRHQGSEASRYRDQDRGPRGKIKQYRRVDGYLSPGQSPIVMNPGAAAHGAPEITTWTFHRPLQTYAKVLHETGFAIELIEEWPSARSSSPGPRAAEENRARREIPLFMAIRAVKVGSPPR
ncbi:MAG TPA: pseudouridine synthase [Phycisphaerales bacterium]|nr:pseudouridine synthase [Phycisphaerales bacterium]